MGSKKITGVLRLKQEGIDKMKNLYMIEEIQKELQSISQGIEQLSTSVENIASQLEKISRKAPSRDARPKRAPVRKKVVLKDGVVEKIKRIPATRIVHDIILKSAQGVDIKTLMNQTGFDQRKIYNVTSILKNQGKIQSVGRGVYGKV
jgi:predicted Rossmann fold nucleotide-binding protein DprA/Smf involved in DNA uptake